MQIDLPSHNFIKVTHKTPGGELAGVDLSPRAGVTYEILKTIVYVDLDYIPNFTHFVKEVE